jgi:hypothetical protein
VNNSLAGLRALREAGRTRHSRRLCVRWLTNHGQVVRAARPERFATGVTLFGYTLPTAIDLGITCLCAVVFRTLAVSGFGKPE